jgi:rsbT co-antagonist protein RsbR
MDDEPLGTLQLENEALRTQLAQAAAELDAIFRALPDLYFRVDAGGIILDYRAGRASDLYDAPNVFLGKRMQDVLPPDVGAICANAIARSLATEAKVRVEYSLPLPSGDEWFEGHVIPFTEEQVILLVHKATEQRRDKEELHRMNAELETRVAERTAALEAANGSLRVFRALAVEAEAQRISLQDQIIEAQRAALRELSTPLMPLADHVVAMPLIGSVDPARAAQIIEVLLQAVEKHSAHTVLLDVTGVPSIDGQVADALVRAAKAVSLLGAQLVLTGIRPEVAQTLVGLEVDLRGLITRSSLEQGIAYALGRRG